ncbi:ABC transporter inner membrane protein [Corynebacterium imitans]|uniref:ABC transporter inner membrane protein n=1 Tax=Corynebacterium imitans TaxID=156978 RepID=A0A076NKB8_9CORY|nr:ABC transporter permease [Corynebacterium imitans]AIJ33868.1 ABC transporter permease [Corynebacterium imitans]SNV76457.1 ABC transporter inner membrane protein [Corynebacterium imitans]
MNLTESIRLATSSLNKNKLRSLLTLLGIIIGIMAVVIIMTLGRGLENQVMSGLQGVGTTTHPVTIHERAEEGEGSEDPFAALSMAPPSNEQDAVTLQDLDDLKASFGERVTGVDIELSSMGEIDNGGEMVSTTIYPVLPESFDMRGGEIEFGRGISDKDMSGQRPVAVVSPELVDAMFDGDAISALGQRIDVIQDGSPAVFTIIGVMNGDAENDSGGGMFGGMESYSDIYIPVTAADRVGLNGDWFTSFSVRSASDEEAEIFQADLQSYLDRLYKGNEDYEAEVIDLSSSLQELTSVFRIMSTVLSAIGGISLLVGGIGVMNIMLITVTERTREIGVRKALGATHGDIRTQFIVEAMLVCLVGGVIGVILGGAIGMIATAAFDAFVWPPLGAVLFSLLFSLATGVFFGAYPASKAAKMQPIEALRYE